MNRIEPFVPIDGPLMADSETLHILVSCESQSQLESYVGCFRELGHNVRAQRVSAGKDLVEALDNPDWDLLIAAENHPELSPLQALQLIRNHRSTLPCVIHLLGTENLGERDYLREGAADVVSSRDDERLSLGGMRAIAIGRDRRELESLRVKYEETARRCELLLATSNDAIGYIVDGMHVDTNDAYARLFGYDEREELAAIPLVDLISPDNQAEFKAALKRYRSKPEDETSIEFTGIREDGAEFKAQLVLSTASFEGEPCMQALVRPHFNPAIIAPASAQVPASAPDAALGATALLSAITTAGNGVLLLFAIDGYRDHENALGPVGAWQLAQQIGDRLRSSQAWSAEPVRAGDDIIGFCIDLEDPEDALTAARKAIENVGGHIFEVDDNSARCSLSAMVCELGPADTRTPESLLRSCWKSLRAHAGKSASLRSTDGARAQLLVAGGAAGGAVSGGIGALSDALAAGQFSLTFQPIISLRGDSAEHYEVRAMHAASGMTADKWLDTNHLRDKTGPLDRWMIETALTELAAHLAAHPTTLLVISVGPGSLGDEAFPDWLGQLLKGIGVDPSRLVIQLSHRAACSRLKQAEKLATSLRERGIGLSVSGVDGANNPMDDLLLLKPNMVKIDESLVRALENYNETNRVIKPLIDALHQDQMLSIMPGVEAAGALAVLWQLGVGYIQGDYLQSPSEAMNYDFADLA